MHVWDNCCHSINAVTIVMGAALRGSDRTRLTICLLYTSDAADEEDSVDFGGRRFII